MEEHHILLFLLQLALLLGCARGLGLLFSRFGQPAITAEILVGMFFGPTILGRILPTLQQSLFPADPIQQGMLNAVAWLGILFFLLDTGLQTDFAAAWRQRRSAMIISASDLVLPMLIAFLPCLLLPGRFLTDPQARVLFAVFVATIMTISALPVTARVLQDLNLYRTDTGMLIMGALTINDVIGWLVFAVILGIAGDTIGSATDIPLILLYTVVFAVACLSIGRSLTNRAIEQFKRWSLPEPGTSLTFICLLGLIAGAFTTWTGIHALFGFFIVGIMAGEARALKENTRHVMHQMVRAVLVPVFFATIGLRIDFAAGFHAGLSAHGRVVP
jgi:Kef-type K+ transport system membrane component KefB